MSTDLIERLNAIIDTGEVSRAALARAAGLHPNSLRKLGAPDWNPTADTLKRLEKADPAAARPTFWSGRSDHRRSAQRPHVHPGRRRRPRE
jgi:hypothetical protein